jgi:hypothetical protein
MYKFTTMVETEADALFLASCLRGVAATNSIRLLKEDGTPVVDGDLKACQVGEVVGSFTVLKESVFVLVDDDNEVLIDADAYRHREAAVEAAKKDGLSEMNVLELRILEKEN